MRLRLWHAADGTRVAYREVGTGPAFVLLHSAGLTHREWEPAVEHLTHRFRLVLPDLPLHGASEDDPCRPYTRDWFVATVGAFCTAVAGPRPLVAGHGLGAELLLRGVLADVLRPSRLVLTPTRLHGPCGDRRRDRARRLALRAGSLPGLDRAMGHLARAAVRPGDAEHLTARANPAAGDLVRHAVADVGGNAGRARSWARHVRSWPTGPDPELLEAYARVLCPTLLLWAGADERHPVARAEEALARLPDGQLRVLHDAGFLIAYDDPVGVARELLAFCG